MVQLNRKSLFKVSGLAIASTMTLPLNNIFAEETKRTLDKPNVILIMADDMGYYDMGRYNQPDCYSKKKLSYPSLTPNLDKMAEKGVIFTDYHSNGAACTPTRAALLTGMYQQRTGLSGIPTARDKGIKHKDEGIPDKFSTMGSIFKKSGYKTGIYGKWHLGYYEKYHPTNRGFDEFKGFISGNIDYHTHVDMAGDFDWWQKNKLENEKGYVTKLITDHSINFIEKNKDKPFLLYVSHAAPHFPTAGPYEPGAIKRKNKRREPGKRQRKPKRMDWRTGEKMSEADAEAFVKDIHDSIPTAPTSYKSRGDSYDDAVLSMDDGIGRIIKKLDELKIADNTIVFFCSDNGSYGKQLPFRSIKGNTYEGGHRVPAVAYWPGKIKPDAISNEIIMSMDLLPTFASMCGINISEKLDGIDVSSNLLYGKKIPSRNLFWQYGVLTAMRMGNWKMVNGKELYDLKNDIGERKDLSKDNPEIINKMALEYQEWYTEVSSGVKQIGKSPKIKSKKNIKNKKNK